MQELFVALPIVGRSSIQPPVEEWINGNLPGPKWDAQFDTFVDFSTGVVAGFLPWLFRAAEPIAGVVGGWGESVPWRDWADLLEDPTEVGELAPDAA